MPSRRGFQVVLVEPDIPFNTGSVARLCVATESMLHLVGRLGFHLDDRRVRRAGLDYWEHAQVCRHVDWDSCRASMGAAPVYYFSAHAQRPYTEAHFAPGSVFVFGSETRGLPESMLADRARCWTIPIFDRRVRSLNLATAVAIVLYEAIRQNQSATQAAESGTHATAAIASTE